MKASTDIDCSPDELRVLLLVPTTKDASVAMRLLAEGSLSATPCTSISRLVTEIDQGAAAVMTTEELLDETVAGPLLAILEKQEGWSDLPVVVLMRGGSESARAHSILSRLTNVTILERPAPLRTVLSAVQAAVRGRRRQYETRTQIETIREAEAKALKSERAKDDFLAALSHELRTPLNPVLLVASEAAEDPSLPSEARAKFELIAKNVSLEARLIDDLLDLTRITRGKMALETQPLDLVEVVKDAVNTVRPDSAAKAIEVVASFSAGPAIVAGDPVRLQQVIWNVLKNAIKFTPEGGRVDVRLIRDEGLARVMIEIRDTGIGLSAEEIALIFEAFTQGTHASPGGTHRFGGLGLGLAISRSLIQLHGGEISATSPGQGLGSTFTISLPLAPAVSAAQSQRPPSASPVAAPAGVSPLRILLVEDHDPTRTVLAHLLTQRKHEVRSAGSLAEARSIAKKFTFDLLLTDLGLPDGSGYELMEELRDRPGLKGIALTGYGMEQDVERSKQAGFRTHLIKPLQVRTLDVALRMVTAEPPVPSA